MGKDVVILHDANLLSSLPQDKRDILISRECWEQVEGAGHVLLRVYDVFATDEETPTPFQPFLDAMDGESTPRVAVRPLDGGTVETFALPDNCESLLEQLGS